MPRKSKSVEISFGTLFSVKSFGEVTQRVDVITDVGEKNYFYCGPVHANKKGERSVRAFGTGGPENFGRIVGQMTPDEVIEAARRGAKESGYDLTPVQLANLQESARKGPRKLWIDPSE